MKVYVVKTIGLAELQSLRQEWGNALDFDAYTCPDRVVCSSEGEAIERIEALAAEYNRKECPDLNLELVKTSFNGCPLFLWRDTVWREIHYSAQYREVEIDA